MGFRLDRPMLERLIARYEIGRARSGMGSMLYRVTPQQRIDALQISIAAYASGGVPEGDQRDFWLKYLRPVLAETSEAAAALDEAYRDVLRDLEAQPRPGWIERLTTWLRSRITVSTKDIADLARRRVGISLAILLACFVVVVILVEAQRSPWQRPRPEVEPGPYDQARQMMAETTSDSRNASAYELMRRTTLRAIEQYGDDLTPRALAIGFSGEWPHLGPPASLLARMLRRFPLPADRPVPHTRLGALALAHYTAQAAAATVGDGTASFEAMIGTDDQLSRQWTQAQASGPALATPAAARAFAPSWPWWIVLLPFTILIPAAAWAFSGRAALRHRLLDDRLRAAASLRRDVIRNARSGEKGLPELFQTWLDPPPKLDGTRTARRLLRLREDRPGRRLDAARSLRATLASDGDLITVMRPASRAVEFVFLVRRRHRHDHERARVLRLLSALSQAGVTLTAYDYAPDPRSLTATARADPQAGRGPRRTLDLRGLRELHADAVLVLVSDGEELLEPLGQTPYPFVIAELRCWPRRMLLTPTPVAEWGEREMRLAFALDAPIGRATMTGLGDLALGLAPSAPEGRPRRALRLAAAETRLQARIMRWCDEASAMIAPDPTPPRPSLFWNEDRLLSLRLALPPAPETQKVVVEAIQRWLGAGYFWFAACGLYPQLRFDLTLCLGQRLRRFGEPANPRIFTEAILERLCGLPWLRSGHLPDWLRIAAFAELSDREQRMAKGVIDGLLSGARPALAELRNLPVWQPDWSGQPLSDDEVVLERAGTTPEPPPVDAAAIAAAVAADANRRWLRRGFWRIAGFAAWAAIASWLWPMPAEAPHPIGAWWPLAAFVIVSLLLSAAAILPRLTVTAPSTRAPARTGPT
ncbi:hypothetical protein DWF00_22295 [Bosea caraganae]|uniref:Uncharacterized protein n=1 Tax=Bosea caraganae TaxID=2763117 RepID=A0A370L5Y0_9HYPH|nr:hypothetical protein [Bosea caraganae]RDJ23362.1 hypothetical protein DWF00_22295 [Bosea caraganae]RDJ24526.1 hypothetical protein DWE98_12600 [Bosea caraganae]